MLNRFKRQFLSHVWLARIVLILLFLILIIGLVYSLRSPVTGLKSIAGGSLRQTDGRTNILLLGISGPGHDGPNNTDTMIILSVNNQTGDPTLISLPRDLWVASLKTKINSVYSLGVDKGGTPSGLLLAKSAVNELTNLKIHYSLGLDFTAFREIIDKLGGLDVNVTKTFDDYEYPIAGRENDLCDGDPEFRCRYEHIHFDAGINHMDGTTALKFVRSRHSTDIEEGTDFARSRRQSLVISALKSKITPKNIPAVIKIIRPHLFTDISPLDYLPLGKLGLKLRGKEFKSFSLQHPDQLDNPAISETYDYQWVLIPKNNDPQTVFSYIQSILR